VRDAHAVLSLLALDMAVAASRLDAPRAAAVRRLLELALSAGRRAGRSKRGSSG
jgi:hypothetical protein